MELETITYWEGKKKKTIKAKKVSPYSRGLFLKKTSPPLLFTLQKEKTFSIFSIFCKPFKALWLDKNMKTTQVIDVKQWKWKITGKGKYLLEIPLDEQKTPTRNRRENRKV